MFGFGKSKEEISQEEHQLYCEVDFWERKKDYGATDEEIEEVKKQIIKYKEIRETVHQGKMYRLKSPFEGNTAWEYVYNDTVVLMYYSMLIRCEGGKTNVKFCGLDENAVYVDTNSGKKYRGSYLMNVGLYFYDCVNYGSLLMVLKKEQ